MTFRFAIAGWLLCVCAPLWAHDVQQVENVTSFSAKITTDLRSREVIYFKPNAVSATKAPAIVLLHYLHGTPEDMADLTNFARIARDAGAWVIVPDGVQGKWNYGTASVKTVDDIKFLTAVINDAVAKYPIDAKRVYMAGYSNGGQMAQHFACLAPGLVAAIGVVSTTIEQLDAPACVPAIGTPVLYINGVADPIVPYKGNLLKRSVADTISLWRGIDGCPTASVDGVIADTVDDGTSTVTHRWNCASGLAVEQYIVTGGGHTWPGSTRYTLGLGITAQDFNATDVIWAFVSQFSRP
jgi:polyhydroxybutyrate depolymerase